MQNDVCPLCGKIATFSSNDELSRMYSIQCPSCGEFSFSRKFKMLFSVSLSLADKAMLSGYVREMNSLSDNEVFITAENYNDILSSSLIPHTINAKLTKLILYVYRKTVALGHRIDLIANADYPICYAITPEEFSELLKVLQSLGYIVSHSGSIDTQFCSASITYKGMEYAESLSKRSSLSSSVFVAMWFSPEMTSVYETAIKPAIEAKECGSYKAFRVDNHEHNNDITDEIIAGIKECRFLVADMTGYRGGVYYEAGFARGLGKSVIFTCRKDWFDGERSPDDKPIKERIHFDINHQNIIVWENPEDLKQRIINRIRATII